MTVSELIKYLQTQPQDMLIIYSMYSENCLMDLNDIEIYDGISFLKKEYTF